MLLPYEINFSDNSDKAPFQIQPGQVDNTSTSLNLPGKGRIDYGELYNENIVHLLENFSSTTSPVKPTRGQLWYKTSGDPSARALFVYDPLNPAARPSGIEQGWVQLVTTSAVDRFHVPVVNSLNTIVGEVAGDIVYLTTDNTLYIFDGSEWRHLATQEWSAETLLIDGGTVTFV